MSEQLFPSVAGDDGNDPATATSGAKVLAGGAWSFLSKVLPQSYVLVQAAVAARFLGVEGMGRQSFIAFVQLSLALLLGLGLNGALLRYVAETLGQRRSGATRSMVDWVWRVEAVAATVAFGVFALVGALNEDLRLPWLLAGVACAFGVLAHVPNAVISGAQRWREYSMIILTVGTVGTAATVVVLIAGGGIIGIFATQAVISGLSLLWTMSLSRRVLADVAPTRGPWSDLRRPLLSFAAVNWIGFALSLIVWRRSEFFFLKRYSTDVEIGLYSVAFAAVAALVSSLDSISVVFAPAVATLSGAGATDRIRTGFSRALRLILYLSLPITAGALAVGPTALQLVFGADYQSATVPLLIMLAIFPVLPLMNLASAMLWGLGRVQVWLTICGVASVVNVTLALLLIPRYGAGGAALANSGTQITAAVAIVLYACRYTGSIVWHVRSLTRFGLAAVVAGVGGWVGVSTIPGLFGLLAGMGAGATAFVVVLAWCRPLPAVDTDWLESSFGRFFGNRVGWAVRRIGPVAPAPLTEAGS